MVVYLVVVELLAVVLAEIVEQAEQVEKVEALLHCSPIVLLVMEQSKQKAEMVEMDLKVL